MYDEDNILWRMWGLISDINANEITDQISKDNLFNWCDTWRELSKELLIDIARQFYHARQG